MTQVTLPPDFDPDGYLSLNPDVKQAGIDAADHYIHHGHREGRAYKPSGRDAFLRRMSSLENFTWLLNRMPAYLPPDLVVSGQPPAFDDAEIVPRVMAAYKQVGAMTSTDGFWDVWTNGLKKPIHDALCGDDPSLAAKFLRDPASSTFFWGFDAIAQCPEGQTEPHELVLTRLNKSTDWKTLYAYWVCDSLISLAEAIGARRAAYPEIEIDSTLSDREQAFDADAVLDEIEAELGVNLTFPNPYPSELGLASKRGIIGFRSVQSLYQAWRLSQIARGNTEFKVLEIGAGLGRTAYFAKLLGVPNYTIVDIPLTNAAQRYFLARTLGPENRVRIMSTAQFDGHAEHYDLIVNVDSWTEMPKDVAHSYWEFAMKHAQRVLSINHEFNSHTVREMYCGTPGIQITRNPYPMRRGYLEEDITITR